MNQASEEIAALISKAQDKLKTARMNFDITREDAEKALLNAESIVSSFSSHLNV